MKRDRYSPKIRVNCAKYVQISVEMHSCGNEMFFAAKKKFISEDFFHFHNDEYILPIQTYWNILGNTALIKMSV